MAHVNIISVLVLLLRWEILESKIIQGTLRSDQNWEFLTRFCFLSNHGMFEYEIEYPKKYKTQNLLLYHDEKHQWPAVYKKNKTCKEKESVLIVPNGQVIFLNESLLINSGCTESYEEGKEGWLHCQSRRIFQSRRERWWFIAVSNCETTRGLYLRYRITMTNDEYNLWFKHFSADELCTLEDCCYTKESYKRVRFYKVLRRKAVRSVFELCCTTSDIMQFLMVLLQDVWIRIWCASRLSFIYRETLGMIDEDILQVDICFLVLYIFLLLMSFVETYALRARHLLHRTYLLYLFSVIFECMGLSFLCAHYSIYAQNGTAGIGLKLLGKSAEALSTLFLLTLLLLIAKGYTVTRGRLPSKTKCRLYCFLSCYVVAYIGLYFIQQRMFDPGEVLYIYESSAGFAILGMRLLGWIWFVYAVIFTMIHYPEKSNFYTKIFLLYSLWFLSAPVVILISTFIVPKWVREKLINTVELFISITAHLIFFILTRPSKANKNFPYHVRTSQIGIMAESNGGTTPLGDNSLDKFSHHPYEVSQRVNTYSVFGLQARGAQTEMAAYDNIGHTVVQNGHTSVLPS